MENLIGISAGIFTASSLLPQLIKMVREKKATDISVVMLLILLTGLGLWIWYGFLKQDLPLIITNSFSFIINIIILALKSHYPDKSGA